MDYNIWDYVYFLVLQGGSIYRPTFCYFVLFSDTRSERVIFVFGLVLIWWLVE